MESGYNQFQKDELKALLHFKQLKALELLLMITAVDHCSDESLLGPIISASYGRLENYSKISYPTIERLVKKFRTTHWWSMIAPPKAGAHPKPGIYRINIHAIPDDPQMARYLDEKNQLLLPGIERGWVPGERFPEHLTPSHHSDGRVSKKVPPPITVMGGEWFAKLHPQTTELQSLNSPPPITVMGAISAPSHHSDGRSKIKSNNNNNNTNDVVEGVCVVFDLPTRETPSHHSDGRVPNDVELLAITEAMAAYAGTVDQKAVIQLIQACREQAPDATAAEIVYFIHEKGGFTLHTQSAGNFAGVRTVHNPVGFLLHAVPKCFEGPVFAAHRKRAAASSSAVKVESKLGSFTAAGLKQNSDGSYKL